VLTQQVNDEEPVYVYPKKKRIKIPPWGWAVIIVIIILIIGFLKDCGGDSNKKPTSKKKSTTKEWYEGGTLHKAKVADWKNGTEANKLATCADYMVNVDNTISATDLKRQATALKDCINEATKGTNELNATPIAEMAALCLMAMGY
jgi:hypothetical protein